MSKWKYQLVYPDGTIKDLIQESYKEEELLPNSIFLTPSISDICKKETGIDLDGNMEYLAAQGYKLLYIGQVDE